MKKKRKLQIRDRTHASSYLISNSFKLNRWDRWDRSIRNNSVERFWHASISRRDARVQKEMIYTSDDVRG